MWTSRSCGLVLATVLIAVSLQQTSAKKEEPEWKKRQVNHKPKLLSARKLSTVAGLTDIERMYREDLEPLLIPRVAGSPGSATARRHIIQRLESLTGWDVQLDTFLDSAPDPTRPREKHMLNVEFVNIIATRQTNLVNGQRPPDAPRRLVLACHYDSKYFPSRNGREFVGATDSAVPCAMMLDLAKSLDSILQASPLTMVTLQLMFFDGEEAFVAWEGNDNTYGARHLANKLANTVYKDGTKEIDRIDMLVLLDLIGVHSPSFLNHFPMQTGKWFQHMQKVENRLKSANLLQSHSRDYFQRGGYTGGIQDDHIPFLNRAVACFHIIATPFPKPWHRMDDDINALDKDTINNLNQMLQIFTAEYLHLKIPKDLNPEETKPRKD